MEKRDRLFGQLIVDFANAGNNEEAIIGLLHNLESTFGYVSEDQIEEISEFLSQETVRFFRTSDDLDDPLSEEEKDRYNQIEKARSDLDTRCTIQTLDLGIMLDSIIRGETLGKNPVFPTILDYYNKNEIRIKRFGTWTMLANDNYIVDELFVPGYIFSAMAGEWNAFVAYMSDDLAFCTVEFLRSEKNRIYIRRCKFDKCQKYFIATKLNEQNPQKFCKYRGDACKDAYNYAKRKKSGKAAKYMREKRAEGKYQY